jgi:AcrR family transcriptional regulator
VSRPAAPLEALFPGALQADLLAREPDALDLRISDATLLVLSERGTEAASMQDVADRAGVGRATLFRRFGSKDALFEYAIASEVRRFLAGIAQLFTEVTDPRERICEAFAACLRLGDSPLIRGASPARRAALVAALAQGDPAPIALARAFVAEQLRLGQADATVRAGDADTFADGMIRVVLGYFIVPSDTLDPSDPESTRRVALAVAAPIALSGVASGA